jgi:hypothetical protein
MGKGNHDGTTPPIMGSSVLPQKLILNHFRFSATLKKQQALRSSKLLKVNISKNTLSQRHRVMPFSNPAHSSVGRASDCRVSRKCR